MVSLQTQASRRPGGSVDRGEGNECGFAKEKPPVQYYVPIINGKYIIPKNEGRRRRILLAGSVLPPFDDSRFRIDSPKNKRYKEIALVLPKLQ